jgi:hypothetical protein
MIQGQDPYTKCVFAGFLLVHEAVLGPGDLDPVTGALVVGECPLQLEVRDKTLVSTPEDMGCAETTFVQRLYVTLKFVLEQEPLESPFGHREDG